MITAQQVEQFSKLTIEKAELEVELKRIDGFLARPTDNPDNARAIDKGHIMTKFAGTACMIPVGIFNAELKKRKKAIEDRLITIALEFNSL